MKRTNENYQIKGIKEQLINTGELLEKEGVAIIINYFVERKSKDTFELSWASNKETHHATGDDLLSIEQYLEIYKLRLFHLMLKDGSLIRFNFVFKKGRLATQNLLWWPCPFSGFEANRSTLDEVELLMELLEGKLEKKDLIMRSPIRIDFDISKETEKHPLYHMHIENCDTRIAINEPLCINGFLRFILSNFYPDIELKYSEWNYINLKNEDSNFMYNDSLKISRINIL